MGDPAPRNYFPQPSCPGQRQYEALRAAFVEGLSQKDAARRFGYCHGAFRPLVLQFRSAFPAGVAPFSVNHPGAGRPGSGHKGRPAPAGRPSTTSAV